MHRLLNRQLKKAFGRGYQVDEFSGELQSFLNSVSLAYDEYTNERKFLEHILEKNSSELTSANRTISEQNASLTDQLTAISRSRSFLTRLIDSVHMFILTLDRDLNILTANKKFLDSTNKSYQSFLQLFPDDYCVKSFEKDLDSLRTGSLDIVHNDMELYDSYNNSIYIDWSHTIVENEEGQEIILSIGSDLTKRKEAEDALHWLAHNDGLTGLANRRAFKQTIHQTLNAKNRGVLAFIDINKFKQINDVYGHAVGDAVLIQLARDLEAATRSYDFISRLAGDEFTVIFNRITDTEIPAVFDKLLEQLNNYIVLDDGNQLHYSVSIGVAKFPEHASQEQQLIVNADLAMYVAKKKGMGHWHLFDPSSDDFLTMHDDNRQLHILKKAIEENRFVLYYQPICSLEKNEISHYEVLIRKLDVNGKLIFPGDFIPAAERMGLITKIDRWVLDEALAKLADELQTQPDLKFAINISAPSLQQDSMPSLIQELLAKHKVDSRHLIIELTETAYIDNFDLVLNNLEQIDNLGVKIALDDFGVGFSSFSYLKKMPLSFVKLDGSYVRELINNYEDQVFVESVTKMVEAFGMHTVAEFVGDDQTYQRLKDLGVSYGQGFYIGQPKPYLLSNDDIKNNLSLN